MFFLFPVGHDQEVYTRPWLTFAIIAACTVAFLWSRSAEQDTSLAVEQAMMDVQDALEHDPDLRISPEVAATLPAALHRFMAPYTADDADDPGVDTDFEDAVQEASVALDSLPLMRFGYIPAEGGVVRMLTSMFMHEGWFHLIGNMVFLFLAGAVLECFWRPWAYAGLYVLSGLGGAVAHHLSAPTSAVPLIGASGAVAGLMAAFLIGHAQARIRIGYFFWFFVAVRAGTFEMRALYLVPFWALQQVYHAWSEPAGGVAYAGHVGGFLVGLVVALVARKLGWVARDAGYA